MISDAFRVCIEDNDGNLVELASGSYDYARGWRDGYNRYADIDALLVGSACQCGPKRVPYTAPAEAGFRARTGCLHCACWDAPLEPEVTP